MSDLSKFSGIAWIAKYIVGVRPGDHILEFEFPPHTIGAKETIEYLMAMKLPWFDITQKTMWYCYIGNDELFRFLWGEQIKVGPYFTHPDYRANTTYEIKFEISGPLLEDAQMEELYEETMKAMTDDRLKEQLVCAIELERYEHAALIRDEIASRKKLPFLEPLKWRP